MYHIAYKNAIFCYEPASVAFRNLSDAQLISLEFNVLDSLNMKMHRNVSIFASVFFLVNS